MIDLLLLYEVVSTLNLQLSTFFHQCLIFSIQSIKVVSSLQLRGGYHFFANIPTGCDSIFVVGAVKIEI